MIIKIQFDEIHALRNKAIEAWLADKIEEKILPFPVYKIREFLDP